MGSPMSNGIAFIPAIEPPESMLRCLTPLELRILNLVAQNRTSKSIARELHASHRTIQNHRLRMCRKLDLAGYNGLFRFALEHKSAICHSLHDGSGADTGQVSTSTLPK